MRHLLLGWLFLFSLQAFSLVRIDRAEAERRLAYFDYKKSGEILDLKLHKKRRRHNLHLGKIRVFDHTKNKTDDIEFKYYRSEKEGKRPLILIMPSIAGETLLETDTARYFAHRGYHAIIVRLNEDISDQTRRTDQIDNFLIRTTTQIRQIMDWAISTGDVDQSRIVAYGVSLGGIRTSILTTVDKRIKAASMFVAGCDLPNIISRSTIKVVSGYREARMAKENYSTAGEFNERLDDVVEIDAAHFAYRRSREDFFMVIAKKDKIVPTDKQYELWEELGRPAGFAWSLNHLQTALTYKFQLGKIRKFYNNKLGLDKKGNELEENEVTEKDLNETIIPLI